MTAFVEFKSRLVVPYGLLRQAGFKVGDRLEFRVFGGIININPDLPSADDKYTPVQRAAIDAQLAEPRKGPFHGPFSTADKAIRFLSRGLRSREFKSANQ